MTLQDYLKAQDIKFIETGDSVLVLAPNDEIFRVEDATALLDNLVDAFDTPIGGLDAKPGEVCFIPHYRASTGRHYHQIKHASKLVKKAAKKKKKTTAKKEGDS